MGKDQLQGIKKLLADLGSDTQGKFLELLGPVLSQAEQEEASEEVLPEITVGTAGHRLTKARADLSRATKKKVAAELAVTRLREALATAEEKVEEARVTESEAKAAHAEALRLYNQKAADPKGQDEDDEDEAEDLDGEPQDPEAIRALLRKLEASKTKMERQLRLLDKAKFRQAEEDQQRKKEGQGSTPEDELTGEQEAQHFKKIRLQADAAELARQAEEAKSHAAKLAAAAKAAKQAVMEVDEGEQGDQEPRS